MLSRTAERFEDELTRAETPSQSSFGPDGPDFCSRDGAHTLKHRIEAYWQERGFNVQVQLHNVGFHPAIRAARFDVRSDMVNGMPRPKTRQSAPGKTGSGITDSNE